VPTELHAKKVTPQSFWSATAARDSNLIAIVQFCAIGLLVTLITMLSFPDLGAVIVQYDQF
jgi:hypothetical protein